jgi:hypothetical protein
MKGYSAMGFVEQTLKNKATAELGWDFFEISSFEEQS